MSTLLVCHSTGDTEIILDTARSITAESKETVYLLAVGQAAITKVQQDPLYKEKKVTVITLPQILGESAAKSVENAPLSMEQVEIISTYLAKFQIDRALFGTPSQMNAAAPFQIAEKLASRLREGVIYNDYLYFEEGHVYWNTLRQNKPWQLKFKWGLPTQQAKIFASKYNSNLDMRAVGHRAIDAATTQVTSSSDKKVESRQRTSLGINEKQTLLFISSSKNSAEDKALLKTLLTTIHQNSPTYSNIEIRLGLHPGLEADLTAYKNYIADLMMVISKFKTTPVANQVKFIISPTMAPKINLDNISPYLIVADISGDTASQVANGVASAAPATLVNKTALVGKPAYYEQGQKIPFLPTDRLFAGKENINSFLKAVIDKKILPTASKKDLHLPTENTATVLKNTLFTPKTALTPSHSPYLGMAVVAIAVALVVVGGVVLYKNADNGLPKSKR